MLALINVSRPEL